MRSSSGNRRWTGAAEFAASRRIHHMAPSPAHVLVLAIARLSLLRLPLFSTNRFTPLKAKRPLPTIKCSEVRLRELTSGVQKEYPTMTNLTHKSSKQFLGAAMRVVTLALFLVVFGASPALAQTRGYVTNFLDNTVSVIDPATNTVVATIPVGTNPRSVAVTPNGAFAYVGNQIRVIIYLTTPPIRVE